MRYLSSTKLLTHCLSCGIATKAWHNYYLLLQNPWVLATCGQHKFTHFVVEIRRGIDILEMDWKTPSVASVHCQVKCMLKKEPWLTSSVQTGSGNRPGELGEIPSVRQPKRLKRLQRTEATKNQSGSSRSQLKRSHLWSTFLFGSLKRLETSWADTLQGMWSSSSIIWSMIIHVQRVHADTLMIPVHVWCRQKDAFSCICVLYTHRRVLSLAQCLPPASLLRWHLALLGPSHMQTLVCQTRLLPHIRIRIRAGHLWCGNHLWFSQGGHKIQSSCLCRLGNWWKLLQIEVGPEKKKVVPGPIKVRPFTSTNLRPKP